MIKIDNIEYRNLQEQVLKNKQDIEKHYKIDRVLANLGIRVVGRVDSAAELPDPTTYQGLYGDAYAVGAQPEYEYYVFTRPDVNAGEDTDYWLNVGGISVVGPQGVAGPQGPQGEQGERGASWTSINAPVNALSKANRINGDLNINPISGDVAQLQFGLWTLVGNIKGAQGLQGPQGERGPQGIQGVAGPQGPQGASGQSFTIAGTVATTSQLPAPTESNRSSGYLVGNNTDGYNLYIVIGTTSLSWFNAGPVTGIIGPQGPQGEQGEQGEQGPRGLQGDPGINWRGEWDSTLDYLYRDAVTYNNGVYYLTEPSSQGNQPDISPDYWSILVQAPSHPSHAMATYQVPRPSSNVFAPDMSTSGNPFAVIQDSDLPSMDVITNIQGIYVEGYFEYGTARLGFSATAPVSRILTSGTIQFVPHPISVAGTNDSSSATIFTIPIRIRLSRDEGATSIEIANTTISNKADAYSVEGAYQYAPEGFPGWEFYTAQVSTGQTSLLPIPSSIRLTNIYITYVTNA